MPITISGSTGISGVDGTVSSPAVQGADTNTGVYYPAADQVAIATGGVQRLLVDATGTVTTGVGALYPLVSGTAVASTSGTSIDFTGIPSWVKRITVMFNGVSTNGTSGVKILLGTSGGVETSGYLSSLGQLANSAGATGASQDTTGFTFVTYVNAADTAQGSVILTLLASNAWVAQGMAYRSSGTTINTDFMTGSKTTAGVLDRIRVTTVNGTDTFDAGSVNILYE